ncbi:MAG TPA: hypothetical protein VEZ55_06385 [Chitinophagaceae bacterium]|nr:hypothetical protein [Chitinophagaceae bacterium]
MTNKLFLLLGSLLLYTIVMAQARDGTADLQRSKLSQSAALLNLPYSPDITRKAFSDYLSKTSNKDQKNAKDYLLSGNTLLAKNNVSQADMHFLIGNRDKQNKNESVIYLKLNSFSTDENGLKTSPYYFDMQQAMDYLDNLAVAIQPYAAGLQLRSQQKDLADSKKVNVSLADEGDQLEAKRIMLNYQISENERESKVAHLAKRKLKNDKKIDENLLARAALNNSIKQQTAALALLKL